MKIKLMLVFCLLNIFLSHKSQAADTLIEKGHIEEMFFDTTVEGFWTETGKTTYAYFSPNGRLYYDGSPAPFYFANWFIAKDGAVCTNDQNRSCMYVTENGRKYRGWFARNGTLYPIVVINIVDGDPRQLAKRAESAAASQRNYENQRALALTALFGIMISSGGGSNNTDGKTSAERSAERIADRILLDNAERAINGR